MSEEPGEYSTQNAESKKEKIKAAINNKKGELIVLAVIVSSFFWYLLSDRYTPYTTQARLESYVAGIAPEVSGNVEKVHVINNQRVSKGELLFTLETNQYQIALDSAKSQLDSTWKQVEAGDSSVLSARAALEAAKADKVKAEKDATRLKRLYTDDPGTISVRRLEVSEADLESAIARVDKARADIDKAISQKGGDNNEQNALLRAAQSTVDQAQLDLENTKILAPVSGIVTDLRTDTGYFAGAGVPVITLLSNEDIWVNANYTENNLRFVKKGSLVEILFDAMPGRVFDGVIDSVGLGISASHPPVPGDLPTIDNNRDWLRQAQRFPVVIRFDVKQDPELVDLLRVGGQASVITYTPESSVLKILGKGYIRIMSFFSYLY